MLRKVRSRSVIASGRLIRICPRPRPARKRMTAPCSESVPSSSANRPSGSFSVSTSSMAYTRRPCANSSVMPVGSPSRGSTQWLKIHSRSFPDTPAPQPAKAAIRRPLSSVSSCQPIQASPPSSEAARTSLVAASQAYCLRSSLKNADFRFISVICSTPGFILLMFFSIWIPLPFFRSLCQDGFPPCMPHGIIGPAD